jgi:23S rRNA pseudouridine955/2504/2580 synthase
MKTFIVDDKYDSRNLLRVITGNYPVLEMPILRKALRNRDIRLNGKRIREDQKVRSGDEVTLFIPDEVFEKHRESVKPSSGGAYNVTYSDNHLIVAVKKPGLAVHSGKGIEGGSLVDLVRNEFGSDNINLCHRIDMNTGGLVLLGRDKKTLSDISAAIKNGILTKRYRCLVRGVPDAGKPVVCTDKSRMFEIRAFLERSRKSGEVFIHNSEHPGDFEIITRYRILNQYDKAGPDGEPVSELEVELVTGRTHQIRAHLAHLGHPVLGDGKYGRNSYNRFFRNTHGDLRYQQLWATSLIFGNMSFSSELAHLSGRVFKCKAEFDIDF